MEGLMSSCTEPMGQTAWEVRVDKQCHAVMGYMCFTWLKRVANANTTKISASAR